MAKIIGYGAPTSSTPGTLGQEYFDKDANKNYTCVGVKPLPSTTAGELKEEYEWTSNTNNYFEDRKDTPVAVLLHTFESGVQAESFPSIGLVEGKEYLVAYTTMAGVGNTTKSHEVTLTAAYSESAGEVALVHSDGYGTEYFRITDTELWVLGTWPDPTRGHGGCVKSVSAIEIGQTPTIPKSAVMYGKPHFIKIDNHDNVISDQNEAIEAFNNGAVLWVLFENRCILVTEMAFEYAIDSGTGVTTTYAYLGVNGHQIMLESNKKPSFV